MTIVVKLGTTLIVDDRGRVRARLLRSRAREIATVVRGGEPVCIVSSGAIALGLVRLGLTVRPRSIARLLGTADSASSFPSNSREIQPR